MKDKIPFKTILIRMITKSDDSYTTFLRVHAIVLINSYKLSHTKWILKRKIVVSIKKIENSTHKNNIVVITIML